MAKILGLKINPEKDLLVLETSDGLYKIYVEADCCSRSWIEHISGVKEVIGKDLISFVSTEMKTGWASRMPLADASEWYKKEKINGDGVLEYYRTQIKSTGGDLTLEYRNESNGYYGANLKLVRPNDVETGHIYDWKGSSEVEDLKDDF